MHWCQETSQHGRLSVSPKAYVHRRSNVTCSSMLYTKDRVLLCASWTDLHNRSAKIFLILVDSSFATQSCSMHFLGNHVLFLVPKLSWWFSCATCISLTLVGTSPVCGALSSFNNTFHADIGTLVSASLLAVSNNRPWQVGVAAFGFVVDRTMSRWWASGHINVFNSRSKLEDAQWLMFRLNEQMSRLEDQCETTGLAGSATCVGIIRCIILLRLWDT